MSVDPRTVWETGEDGSGVIQGNDETRKELNLKVDRELRRLLVIGGVGRSSSSLGSRRCFCKGC